jgi:3-oxoacyl-[acyl-carrier-protein] synthase-3
MLCRWGVEPSDAGSGLRREFMTTDAAAVLEHGVALGRATWDALLSELGWTASSIDAVISHQVGATHRDAILKALAIAPERDFVAYDALGNTGSCALPLAAALAEQRGFLTAGQRVALLGIGSGLSCTMLGVEW